MIILLRFLPIYSDDGPVGAIIMCMEETVDIHSRVVSVGRDTVDFGISQVPAHLR